MKSTPVLAIARTPSSVTPPLASSSARPDTWATARRGHRRADASGQRGVVLFDQNRVVQAAAVIGASACRHRCLLENTQSGRGLARIEDSGARPLHFMDEAGRQRGDSGKPAQEVE